MIIVKIILVVLVILVIMLARVGFDFEKLYKPYCEYCDSKNLRKNPKHNSCMGIQTPYICNDCKKEVWDSHSSAG
jgi:DNA-directed RNA polymerase subunit RPC12/RpoP